jgi:MmyB-like transcription regulator ligand binding domain
MAWNKVANDTVAVLSAEAGRHPYDRRLSDLIGGLSTRSDEFVSGGPPRTSRPQHRRQAHPSPGRRRPRPVARVLPIGQRSQPEAPTYTAEPGSRSQYAPRLLARWAATTDGFEPAASTDTS